MIYNNSLYALTQNRKAARQYSLPKGGLHSQISPSNFLQALSVHLFQAQIGQSKHLFMFSSSFMLLSKFIQ
jgi:hypothetical protein